MRKLERFGAVLLIVGLALFSVSALLHPLEFDPKDPSHDVAHGHTMLWIMDHLALLVATLLVALGVALFHARVSSGRGEPWWALAVPPALASFTLWVTLFAFEALSWPALAEHMHRVGMVDPQVWMGEGAAPTAVLTRLLWTGILGLGYVAVDLLAIAILAWSLAARQKEATPTWFGWVGLAAGLLTLAATPVAWLVPRLAVWVMLPGSGLIGVWLVGVAWLLWRGVEKGNR